MLLVVLRTWLWDRASGNFFPTSRVDFSLGAGFSLRGLPACLYKRTPVRTFFLRWYLLPLFYLLQVLARCAAVLFPSIQALLMAFFCPCHNHFDWLAWLFIGGII